MEHRINCKIIQPKTQSMAVDNVMLLLLLTGWGKQAGSFKVTETLALFDGILCEQNYSVTAPCIRNTQGDIFFHGEIDLIIHL